MTHKGRQRALKTIELNIGKLQCSKQLTDEDIYKLVEYIEDHLRTRDSLRIEREEYRDGNC